MGTTATQAYFLGFHGGNLVLSIGLLHRRAQGRLACGGACLVAACDNQRDDEEADGSHRHHCHVGFGAADGQLGGWEEGQHQS